MVSDGFANSERLQIDPVSKDIRLKPYEIEDLQSRTQYTGQIQ